MPSLIPHTQQSVIERTRELMLNEDTYATSLIALVVDRYGTEALGWHPTTLRMQLEQDLGLRIPKGTLDKVMAAVTIMTTNLFYRDVSKFISICNILAGDDFDPTVFDPADAVECAWGITEALMLWPPESSNPFSEEIVAYVSQVLKDEGLVQAPDVLRIASDPEQADRIRSDFADDPDMFSAVWQMQRDKADDITQTVKGRIAEMTQELRSLPLVDGNTEKIGIR